MAAILLSLLLLIGYFWLIYYFSKDWFSLFNKEKLVMKIAVVFCIFLPGLFMLWMLKQERFIYYWDFSGYWDRAIKFTNQFFDSPFEAFEHIYNTIRHSEYNVLPNLLIAPINKLIGLGFEYYIFSVYLIYCIPLSLVLSSILIRNSSIKLNSIKVFLPFLCLLFSPLLIPIRYGFVDVIGLLPIFIIIYIVDKENFLRNLNYKSSIIIGILILVLVFSRRWYAFWATSFYLSIFIVNAIYAFRKKDKKVFIASCLNLFIAGIVPLGIMLLFFYPFFEMSVLKDYSDIYSAYRRALPMGQVNTAISYFGLFILLLSVIGIFFFIKRNKSLLLFLFLSTIIIVVLFTRINDFGGYQHYYLVLPLLIFLSLKGTLGLVNKQKWLFPLFIILFAVDILMVFNFNKDINQEFSPFAQTDGSPKIRSDYNEIMNLAEYVGTLEEQGNFIYCLSSSGVLNDNILRNTQLPEEMNAFPNLQITQHVDRRDRFPNSLFLSNYVIVTNPVQLHLGLENQHLVGYFNNEILSGSLSKHYTEIKSFQLQNDVTAHLMKKKSGLTEEEIEAHINYFKSIYPEFPNMYDADRTLLKTSEITMGNGYGRISFDPDNYIAFLPGSERASKISFSLHNKKTKISFTAGIKNKKGVAAECNPEKDGEVNLQIYADGEIIKDIYVTHQKDTSVAMTLEKVENLSFIVDKGKFKDYCDWFGLSNMQINTVTQD